MNQHKGQTLPLNVYCEFDILFENLPDHLILCTAKEKNVRIPEKVTKPFHYNLIDFAMALFLLNSYVITDV